MQGLRSAFSSQRAPAEPRALVIHADTYWLPSIQDGKFDFFRKLVRHATQQGVASRIVALGSQSSALLLDQAQINIIAADAPSYGPYRMHALPSHIWGFWYLDELGTCANASLRFARFCPDHIDAEKAAFFFNGVSSYMLRENISKRVQPKRRKDPLTPAYAVIFCQEIEDARLRSHYLTTEEILRTTLEESNGDRVYIKLHPDQSPSMTQAVHSWAATHPNADVIDASVHDLIAAARVVVTQNAAAGFEALMQCRPVITCGICDYWHATLTAKTRADLRDALRYGPEAMADFIFDKYLYWFLDRNCLEPAKPDFERRAWARIRDKMFLGSERGA